jgi:hypothetical protein
MQPEDGEHLIRITPMILEFCPDLSQQVYPDRILPIKPMNITLRRGTNLASNVKIINMPQT